ncbi:hypothetical protein QFZ68_000760 [Streptomyces sp. V1I6]|nr:hypothetical protein [Streptomyces sp. V1I6]
MQRPFSSTVPSGAGPLPMVLASCPSRVVQTPPGRMITSGAVAGSSAITYGAPPLSTATSPGSSRTGSASGGTTQAPSEQGHGERRRGAVLEAHRQAPDNADRYASVRSGALSSVTGDVEKVLGRPPRDFTDYARTAAAEGAWNL